jgi:hypothetical protein
MESITRNIRDISPPDKLALEHVIGRQLAENQQIIIQICSLSPQADSPETTKQKGASLPDWCNVYAGLSDDEVASLERTVLQRADLTRVID